MDCVSHNKLCFDSCSVRVDNNALFPNCVYFPVDSAIKCNNTRKCYNYEPSNLELLTSCNSSENNEECNEQNTLNPDKLPIDCIPDSNSNFNSNGISANCFSLNSNDVYFNFDSACDDIEHTVMHSNVNPTNVYILILVMLIQTLLIQVILIPIMLIKIIHI